MPSDPTSLEVLLRSHISQETGQMERIDDALRGLTESTAVIRQQWPELVQELRKVAERLDGLERDVALLKPLEQRLADHETRLRAVESSALKLSTQAAVIAAIIGSGLPFLMKLLGAS